MFNMKEDGRLACAVAAEMGEDEQTSMEEDKPEQTCSNEHTWQLGKG